MKRARLGELLLECFDAGFPVELVNGVLEALRTDVGASLIGKLDLVTGVDLRKS